MISFLIGFLAFLNAFFRSRYSIIDTTGSKLPEETSFLMHIIFG